MIKKIRYSYLIKLNILIDSYNKPIGNKLSFDVQNRIPIQKDHVVTPIKKIRSNKYVNINFSSNYGELSEDNFIFPIDSVNSKKWLTFF
jgi:deoxyribodipyrimidine photolyase-like uncharacterized protein